MSQNTNTLTYKQNMSKSELFRIIKAIGIPMLVFGLGIFTISNFATFGAKPDLSSCRCNVGNRIYRCITDAFTAAGSIKSDYDCMFHLFSCSAWVKNLISCCIRRQF